MVIVMLRVGALCFENDQTRPYSIRKIFDVGTVRTKYSSFKSYLDVD